MKIISTYEAELVINQIFEWGVIILDTMKEITSSK